MTCSHNDRAGFDIRARPAYRYRAAYNHKRGYIVSLSARCLYVWRIVHEVTAPDPFRKDRPSSYHSQKIHRYDRSWWRRIALRRAGIALQRERKCGHEFSIRRGEHPAITGGDGGRPTERQRPGPGVSESH